MKGILRQYSVARTPQQNRFAERRNRTLIEAARTMLADSKLPTTSWVEAVNTACYGQNEVLVVKPHNKTPYELFHGRTPTLSIMRPFRCLVTILNTIDHLGKFDGKADEGFFVGYSLNSKAFRVFNSRTRIVEENLHIRFSESTPNVVGSGPDWLFNIDALTRTMNYEPIVAGTQSNSFADPKSSQDDGFKPSSDDEKKVDKDPRKESEFNDQEREHNVNSTNNVNAASTNKVNVVGGKTSIALSFDPDMPALEDISIFDDSIDDEDVGAEADMNNLDTTIKVSPIPTTRIHKDHPFDQVIRDLQLATQTRRMSKNLEEHGFVSTIQQRTNHKDLQNYLFACFLSQEEPKKVIHALKDPSWIETMQEELLQFKLQEVWTLVDLSSGKRAIGTKWVFRNKKDERGIVVRNKARFIAQGYTQEEGIDYDEVFAPVARIEAIRLFLAYASFKDFVVYQMDVKSAFLYGKIEEEVYVCQLPGFEDPDYPDRVYKVEKALYGLHQAPRAWYETLSTYLLENGFQRVQQKKDGIFISQDKYVDEILKKFRFTEVKTASTPIETQKPLLKDENGEEVDVYMYRSMIGSLMYLTSSRPDIMFTVYAYSRYQVNLKVSHLYVVKRIFSDYAGASLDRKSTTEGSGPRCQETMGDTIAQTRFENISKLSNDQLLARGNTLRSGDDRLKLNELMELCTSLQQRVLGLENELKQTKTTQDVEIARLKKRVKRVESSDEEGLGEEDASKQGRIPDIDADARISLVSTHFDADTNMFGVHDLVGDEVVVESEVDAKDVNLNVDEVTLAQALAALTSTKPKAKVIVFREPGEPTTTTTHTTTIHVPKQSQDKGKGIMVEELVMPKKKKDQIKANIAWDDVHAKVEADYQLAQRLQAQEQEELTDEEKNMEGWNHKDLRSKDFDSIKELFNKAFKRVNTFVDYKTELVEESSKKAEIELEENLQKAEVEVMEGSSKRAGEELEQENANKQKKGGVVVQNIQGRQIRVQGNNARGAAAAGNGGAQYRAAPTAQTMFMANLFSVDPVYDEAGPSYDSDTLSKVQDHDNYLDNMNESHEDK
ncbi:putative ribonuclease H-like domain-containing protein [Tanacetum coccineum]